MTENPFNKVNRLKQLDEVSTELELTRNTQSQPKQSHEPTFNSEQSIQPIQSQPTQPVQSQPKDEPIHPNCLYLTAKRYLTDLPELSPKDVPHKYHSVLFYTETIILNDMPTHSISVYDEYPEMGMVQYIFGGDGVRGMHRTLITVIQDKVVIGFLPAEYITETVDYGEEAIHELKVIAKQNTKEIVDSTYYDHLALTDEYDYRGIVAGVYEAFKRLAPYYPHLTDSQKYYIKSELAGSLFIKNNIFTHTTMINFVNLFAIKYGYALTDSQKIFITVSDVTEESILQQMEY